MSEFKDENENFVKWMRKNDEGGGWDEKYLEKRRI